jgi:hypothetical protein
VECFCEHVNGTFRLHNFLTRLGTSSFSTRTALFGVDWSVGFVGLSVGWLFAWLVNQLVSLEARDNLVIYEAMMLLFDRLFCYSLYLP